MIKDSGSRTEFSTGAVRDVQVLEKGRCDLLPLDVVSEFIADPRCCRDGMVVCYIAIFQKNGDHQFLYAALYKFIEERNWDTKTMLLEVAIHMAEGAVKYSERNWEKGIPLSRFVDSGVRHYLKWLRGDKDEPHDRAFCWNMLCGIWTCKHHPELNDYAPKHKPEQIPGQMNLFEDDLK